MIDIAVTSTTRKIFMAHLERSIHSRQMQQTVVRLLQIKTHRGGGGFNTDVTVVLLSIEGIGLRGWRRLLQITVTLTK